MNKKMILSLCMMVMIVVLLSACSNSEEGVVEDNKVEAEAEAQPEENELNENENSNVNPVGQFPIVKEKENIKIFTVKERYVQDIETNDFTKWYEETTNIHVDWEVIPSSGYKERMQVTLAGGNLPDVFMQTNISPEQIVSLGSQKVIIPLNELIEQYAPNIKKMMEQAPYIKEHMFTPDGNIYALPNLAEVLHTTMPKKAWIYKPWLDELNLEMPTNTDEFYKVLKAFKEHKPNAVPFAGANAANNIPTPYVMQSFIYYDDTNYLYLNDGQIDFAADKPAYKEGLTFMKKLVQEELLQLESFVQDRKALTSLSEYPDESRLGAATALFWGHFTVDGGDSGRYLDYTALPVLKGPDGHFGLDRGFSPNQHGAFVITKDAKNPAAIMRWVDRFYDPELMYDESWNALWGQEGTGWKRADSNTIGLHGNAAKYEPIIPFGTEQNHHWSQAAPSFQSAEYLGDIASKNDMDIETRLFRITQEKYKPYADKDSRVPFMFLAEEDLVTFGDIKRGIIDVVNQFEIRFISGELDLESDWDSYLNELKNVGLNDYLEIMREMYKEQIQ